MSTHQQGWIGVDLDGTLARYETWNGAAHIGVPVPRMLARVRQWLSAGKTVKVFTARAGLPEALPIVRQWLDELGLQAVGITNTKDFTMTELWDDRAVSVIKNTGVPVEVPVALQLKRLLDALGVPVVDGQTYDKAVDAALHRIAPKLQSLRALKAYVETINDALGYEVRDNPQASADVRRAFTTATKAQKLVQA